MRTMEEQVIRFKEVKRFALQSVRATVPPSTVPEGQLGPWRIERFSIEDGENLLIPAMRSMTMGARDYTPPGTYTRLVHNERGVIMSDTLDECEDLLPLVQAVKGRVLITGLGLGIAVDAVLRKPEVSFVTVIEKHKRIVHLVGGHLTDLHGTETLEIIRDDAFIWKPPRGVRWDYAWHDIWDEITPENLVGMAILRSRYRRYITGRQFCWAEDIVRKQR
jgi:hypothetical protein